MWPNPQETENLVTFTKISLMENFIFNAVILLCQSTGDSEVDDDSGSGVFCSIVKWILP